MESFGEIVFDASGSPSRIIGVTTDISQRKQTEEALRQSHLQLEQKVAERTRDLAISLNKLESEIATRKSTEAALRELSGRLLRLQDEERRHVARELHDSTGQTLAALKMTLASLRRQVAEPSAAQSHLAQSPAAENPKISQLFDDLNELADNALQEIRTTSYLLHPPMLDEVGFTSAARWYVDGFAKRSGIAVNLSISGQAALSKDAELVFFRVLQECLTNILRHSGSKSVDIQFAPNHHNATLSVQDYGSGIPAEKLSSFERTGTAMGIGLAGMRQRVRELSGNLSIASTPAGTQVRVTLPIHQSSTPASA
jgi:two-component system, NarL family, sensor kinase